MAVLFFQKIKNYIRLYGMTRDQRADFEKIRHEICQNGDQLSQLFEYSHSGENFWVDAYVLNSLIKMTIAYGQSDEIISIPVKPYVIRPQIKVHMAYIVMPDGKFLDLQDKRAKLLFKTAQKNSKKISSRNVIQTNRKYISIF